MRPCACGGTDSDRYSPRISGERGSIACVSTPIGAGIWTRFFVRINGKQKYLWRAVDHEGEVLESFVTETRDKAAALKFIKKAMKRHGRTKAIVTDRLRSYGAALKEIGAADLQQTGRRLNNRAENSRLPFRRRERAMLRFRQMKTLQKFSAVYASFHNHFSQERRLVSRQEYRSRRSAALAEWKSLMG